MTEHTPVHVPSQRSPRSAWLVVAAALVGTLVLGGALEWTNRAELVDHLDPPLSRFETSALREFTTAEAWAASGYFAEGGEMIAVVGDRYPDSEIAAYAYFFASIHVTFEDKDRRLELARRAVAVAQPGTRYFAVVYDRLALMLGRAERYDDASKVVEQGLARAVTRKERMRLLARAGGLYEDWGRPDQALAAWQQVAAETERDSQRERAREAIERLTAGESHRAD